MNFDKPPKKVVDYYTKPIHAAAASQNTPIEIKRYQGRVPTDFPAGSYIRNGPNPIDAPPDLWYHMFDGDGMVHNVKFNNNGKVTYCNHQIETERFKERKRVGFDPYMTIGETMSRFFIFRLLWKLILECMGYTRHVSYFKKGTANTAVQSHAGRLFALHDASFPFEIASDPNTGKMSSVGYFDYNEQLKHGMTGHPKADPNNGELIFFGYDMFKPFASVTAVSKFGEIIYSLPLYQLDRCVMMHDFAITKNYVLVCNLSLAFTPMNACSNMIPNTPFKSAFEFDTSRPARIGLLPRDKQLASEENIRWFNILPAFFFHVFNAWEEQDTQSGDHIIKLIACRVNDDSIDIYDVENLRTTVYQWELNLSTGDVHEFPLLFKWTDSDEIKPIHADFPAMSDQKVGTKADIGYFTFVAVKPTYEYRGGFVKVDFRSQPYPTATPVYLPYGHFTTESSFVHRVRGGGGEEGTPREGDGYLVSMINNLEGDAECWILDADTLDIKFKGEIPQKVPLGFHGSYILEK